MASNVAKVPHLKNILAKHHFATQAAAATQTGQSFSIPPLQPVKATALPNKVVVAGVENYSPISRVSIVLRAGSRFETSENLGCTHALRIAAGLSTENYTHFGIRRTIQQAGGNLTCTAGRETIAYTLETTRDKIEDLLKILEDVVCHQKFKPWEISDNLPRLKLDLARRTPHVMAVELLHKAAFRGGLGNSIYSPKYMVGRHNPEMLKHYVNSLFVADRTALVGSGVDPTLLMNMAHSLPMQSSSGNFVSAAPKFHGDELRNDTGSEFACVAVAGQSAGLSSGKEALAFAVLQYALGVGPQVKWGSGSNCNPLTRGVAGADSHAAVSALSVAHSDAGLFGFVLAAPAQSAGKAVDAAVKVLRGADSIGDAEINKGKAQLRTALHLAFEQGDTMAEEIGLQAALLASHSKESTLPMSAPSQIKAAIDGVSTSDVKAAAKKIASGKLCMSAVGDLSTVPYLDQLK
ncbi:cytochrome b-c1 complex subunit 2, mitochondrial [Hetaerina americana]|uniref:cytochrome b-c1 complex subunit 2, mitochondrial n=1 Tax=Hetaerina americana TaxID=62018 RepID=UPI003A7F46E9